MEVVCVRFVCVSKLLMQRGMWFMIPPTVGDAVGEMAAISPPGRLRMRGPGGGWAQELSEIEGR